MVWVVLGSCALVVALVTAMWVWATWGEDPYRAEQTNHDDTAAAAAVLQQRVTAEERSAQVIALSKTIQDVASAVSPATVWTTQPVHHASSECEAPFDRTYGVVGGLTYAISQSPMPEKVWPEFYERVRAALEPHHLDSNFIDQASKSPRNPNVPAITFTDPSDGTKISVFNSETTADKPAATTISATLGCHLPAMQVSSPVRPTP
ncbi:LppA family lipoprotein [Nocardia neocaledoniensis]|uniref:LppA family lipoprotein n=1 Tax=Nocardia neocaledoniensis TaxID=236511 RepID=UPI0011B4653F|nr:LppA family lipoprotein [Nocardia neocaledoniensis]